MISGSIALMGIGCGNDSDSGGGSSSSEVVVYRDIIESINQNGYVVYSGILKNMGSRTVSMTTIYFFVYDSNGVRTGVGNDNCANLAPGEVAGFTVNTFTPKANVASYIYRILLNIDE